ncbi:magnesium transporter CorA family protein [Oenococcus alcoholitolerans]|uniref:Mg2+ and Co2+ transporter n=1 Tax=Oenococcus alcoholitolerans TaxID=931074 RepID=A0ABR4XSP3_9LACO|nr:Mg2+ and Co2+ transporter [Oenococcus alcoholitolerans]
MIKIHDINKNLRWYEVQDPDQEEQNQLVKLGITPEFLFYALDPNESARTEIDQPTGSVLIVFDIITPNSDLAATEPVGIILDKEGRLFTIARQTTAHISKKILAPVRNNVDETSQENLNAIDAFLDASSVLIADYISAITTINRQRNIIQSNLRQKLETGAVSSLMELETSMIYMLDSLRTDRTAISRLQAYLSSEISKHQEEFFEDVLVENTQAIDMANQAAEVIASISSAYSNLNNQRLDRSLRTLTMLQALMAVPTLVTGFYGMNVHLPLANFHDAWILTFAISLIMVLVELLILYKAKFFDR